MLYPDPYSPHPPGVPYHARVFDEVVNGLYELLRRLDRGLVDADHALRGKDNGPRKHDTLDFWLFWQHHPQSERWKCLGQRYWSVTAWRAWRCWFLAMPPSARRNRSDGFPTLATLPKGKGLPHQQRGNALRSEHVVPKKVIQRFLLRVRDRDNIARVLRLNLCCVVTRDEDRRLPSARHPDEHRPVEQIRPWNRYRNKGIVLLENPGWTDAERNAVVEAGLVPA